MKTKLLYSRPAQSFQDAMPLGNGRLGAMVFGRPLRREDYYSERIVLNEESLWYGGENARENPDSANALAEVRRLLLEGRVKEAEYLADSSMTATPRNGTPYQMLGELVFTARVEHEPVSNYRRELDLETGIATVSYETSGGLFTLRAFCSSVDGVLVIELSTDSKAGLDFHVYLRRRPFDGQSFRESRHAVGISGQAGPDGVKFAAALRGESFATGMLRLQITMVAPSSDSSTRLEKRVLASATFQDFMDMKLVMSTGARGGCLLELVSVLSHPNCANRHRPSVACVEFNPRAEAIQNSNAGRLKFAPRTKAILFFVPRGGLFGTQLCWTSRVSRLPRSKKRNWLRF